MFFVLPSLISIVREEKLAPREVPSCTSWGCEHPQLRTAALIKAKLEFFVAVAKPQELKFVEPARIFVEVSNQSSNDSFLDFVFEKFVIGYHESFFLKKRI